jgi:hypothetical protein
VKPSLCHGRRRSRSTSMSMLKMGCARSCEFTCRWAALWHCLWRTQQ